jgi:hypothetical protein
MAVTPSGLTFPNASTQTVAYPGSTGFLLKADNLSGLADTAVSRTNLGLGTMATATASDYSTTTVANGLYYPLSSNPSSYLVAADITGKADLASPALTGNVTITTNSTSPALVIVQDGTGDVVQFKDVTSDTTYSFINAVGKVTTIPAVTDSAGFNVPHGTAPTTLVNGDIWTTTGGLFARINGSSNQIMDLTTTQTVAGSKTFSNASLTFGNSTAAGTIAIGNGATVSGSTKTVNIGTNGVSGSTTGMTLGPAAGASNISIGATTAASTLNLAHGATLTATTKAVNIGTNGVAGSTTNIAIGSTTGTSTTTLQGITNGVTQTAGDSSLKLATTAFVTTADNLKANLASPALTGTPTAPTATPGTNTTQIATTAFVTAAVPAIATFTTPTPTSTTTTVSPRVAMDYIMHPGRVDLYGGGYGVTSGTGAGASISAGTNRTHELVGPNTGVAGYAGYYFDETYLSYGMYGFTRGAVLIQRAWNKAIWASGRCHIGVASGTTFNGDANSTIRVSVGGKSSTAGGDLSASEPGFGWKIPGMGSAMQLQVSNGSAVTTVTSSFTPVAREVFDWKTHSDGAGNVTLWINDSQVATTTGGPSTSTPENYNYYFEQVEQTSAAATRVALYSLNPRVWWGV